MLDPTLISVPAPSPVESGLQASTVFVGLGSNLGDRLATLQSAARALRDGEVPGTVLVRCSPVYETLPLGPSSWPYMNAVVELRTVVAPSTLLGDLQALERQHGRTRRQRWEARTLDLDLLVWVGHASDAPGLRLPHPELAARDFVLEPLTMLAADLRPRGPHGDASVSELLALLRPEARTIVRQVAEPLC